jgi:CelD/BcsL family acetyltransferase involved in cellulose biosynthesis
MTVDVITTSSELARLEGPWRALEETPGLLGLFCGYTWQREWWQALGEGRALRILVAHIGREVAGILPLYEELRDGARCLAFIGSPGGGSDDLDVLARDGATRALLVREATGLGADLLDLEDISSTSPLVPELLSQASERRDVAVCEPRYPCPFIPIRTSWARFQETIARRENLRRRQKWFAAQPGFRIQCDTTPEAVPDFLDRYFRLHAARWAEDAGSQAFLDPRLVVFQRVVNQRLAQENRLRMWTLFVAGEAVAVAYAYEEHGRSLYYQSGFLPAWGARSAGLVLFARYVEDAFERGLKEIDLLRGNEAYKADWTQEARQTVAVRWPLNARGRAALAWRRSRSRARDALRAAMPEKVRFGVTSLLRRRRMRGAA